MLYHFKKARMGSNFKQSLLFFCFFFYCIVDVSTNPQKKSQSPVILVPGDGASGMFGLLSKTDHHCLAGKTWFQIWINVGLFLLGKTDCIYKYFRLIYDSKTRSTHNVPGIKTGIRNWGATDDIEHLDSLKLVGYYSYLVKELVKSGYVKNKDLRGAPYDFRKAPNDNKVFVPLMMALVEETYHLNNASRVVLVAHSLGNLYIQYFLRSMSPAWKKKFVRGYVAVAPPLAGTMQAVLSMTSGDFFHLECLIRDKGALRDTQRTLSSGPFLFPSPKLWKSNEVLVSTPKRNYTVANYQQLFSDIPFPDGWEMYKDSSPIIDPSWVPDVDEVFCAFGTEVPTPETLIWNGKKQFPDDDPVIKSGDGDGTVNLRSLRLCLKWPHLKEHWAYPRVSHVKILKEPSFASNLKRVLFQPDKLHERSELFDRFDRL